MPKPDHQNQLSFNPADLIAAQTLSVTDAVALLNGILEPLTLQIEGEVSGYKVAQSKFAFFDIKDETSLLNCFIMVWQLPFPLEDGMRVRLQGQPRLRAQNGRFSLTVKSVELIGEGALQKAFEQLKARLEAEGLFDPKWKQPLPFFPRTIGIITSKTGDALQDIQRIMANRAGGLRITLAPVAVQGQTAVQSIINAIQHFNLHHPVEVLILARGGGSLEDLQAFNAEPLVRAIFASKIPIVCGVGHEPDVTLADLVADVRAATPTNAAEIVTPDFAELESSLQHLQILLTRNFRSHLDTMKQQIDAFAIQMKNVLATPLLGLERLSNRVHLQKQSYAHRIESYATSLNRIDSSMRTHHRTTLTRTVHQVSLLQARLENLDLRVQLDRGYSIVTDARGRNIRSVTQLKIDDMVSVKLRDGKSVANVVSVQPEKE